MCSLKQLSVGQKKTLVRTFTFLFIGLSLVACSVSLSKPVFNCDWARFYDLSNNFRTDFTSIYCPIDWTVPR